MELIKGGEQPEGWKKRLEIQCLEFANFVENTFRTRVQAALKKLPIQDPTNSALIGANFFDALVGSMVIVAANMMGITSDVEEHVIGTIRQRFVRLRELNLTKNRKVPTEDLVNLEKEKDEETTPPVPTSSGVLVPERTEGS